MINSDIPGGVVHDLPEDIKNTLNSNTELLEKWINLTPLSRNEWICWVISVKKQGTREQHLLRLQEEIFGGKRRPCCWPGCAHRKKVSI